MMEGKENNIDQGVSAFSVPNEIVHFFRNYFMGDKTDPEVMLRAELLSRVLIKFMLQLYRLGIEDEFQPVFVAANYVKSHTGDVTECKRTYETIGGEPYGTFNLAYLSQKYEDAYGKWIKKTFGVELGDEAAEFFQRWGGVQ